MTVNYPLENIFGFDTTKSYEYASSPTGSYKAIALSANGEYALGKLISTSPRSYYFRERANQENPYSASAKIDIPKRRTAPTSAKFVYNDMDTPETQAVLKNINPSMEYKQSGVVEYTSFTSDFLIFDIPNKSTSYYIREKATESEFASLDRLLSIRIYSSKPNCSINTSTEEIYSLSNIMEYRVDGGDFINIGDMKTISLSEIADLLSENDTCVLEFRYMRREDYPVGQIKTFIIHSRPAVPNDLSYDPVTFILSGVSKDMRYREVGSSSWRYITGSALNLKSLINGRPDVQLEIGYGPKTPSTDNYIFASDSTIINLY